jgi:tetratricopeptide (TPR) repeat protein
VAKAEAYYLESNAIDESMDARSSLAIGLSNLASLYLDGGRLDEEERLRLRVLEIRRSLRDVDGEAVALGALAALHARRQRHSEAESCYRQALEVRTRIGNPGPIISASRALAHFLRQRGRMAEATRLYGDAAVLAEQLEDQDWRWFCQTDAAELALLGGDPAGAVAIWLQALEYFRSKEMHDSVCGALGSIADARERLGHHALAAEALREVVGARRARGAKAAIASAHLALGGHLRLVGRFEEARVELGEALALREAIGNPDKVARAELALARLELRELRLDDAQPRIERALGIFTRLGDPDDLILIRTLSAQLLRARGEDEESDALWDSVLRDARGIGCPVQLANSLSERGADLLLLGRAGDALAVLDEAAALAERAGRTSLRCHLDLLAANALLDLGDVPRTAPLVARARETADRSGEARHRSMLAALGLRIALRERDAGAIAAAEQAARESAAGIPAAADAMSGFATAWLDLAEWHAGSGRNAEAAALAAQALVAATWQRWHRRERARTLAGDQAR